MTMAALCWASRFAFFLVWVVLGGCAAHPPLLFWSGFPPVGLVDAGTISFASEPLGGNEHYALLRRLFEQEFRETCLASLRFVRPDEQPDILLDVVAHPACLGAHIPCSSPSGAYLGARFQVGGEAVVYVRKPRGCEGTACFYRRAGQVLADGLCSAGAWATKPLSP